MASTFARPADLPGGTRRPRLRRRPDGNVGTGAPAAPAASTAARAVDAPGSCAETGAVAPFLKTPASWQVVGCRPVSYLDHVVLTPSAVLAVTTRFYLDADGDDHVRRAWSDIRTAKGAAKLLELTLGGVDGQPPAPVRPVLALWGPGAPRLENGYLPVKGVLVLDPSRPQQWGHLFDEPALSDEASTALAESLRILQVNSNDTPIALAG